MLRSIKYLLIVFAIIIIISFFLYLIFAYILFPLGGAKMSKNIIKNVQFGTITDYIGIKITRDNNIQDFSTSWGGFPVDGMDYLVVRLNEQELSDYISEVKYNSDWHPLPTEEKYKNYFTSHDSYYLPVGSKDGWYLYKDLTNKNIIQNQESQILDAEFVDFIFAILDVKNSYLYIYYKE